LINQTIVYIVNPKAGNRSQSVLKILSEFLNKKTIDFVIEKTQYQGHAIEIVNEYLSKNYQKFVAIGGDGTVNEIASQLINTNATLSIIPIGSGNGLARFLKIPLNIERSLELSLSNNSRLIDAGKVNDRLFFCTMGLGFDALCAKEFASGNHNRGLWNYIRVIFRNYFKFKIQKTSFNDQKISFFSLTFANANQFGNNALIAPDAVIDDEMLDCTFINPHPLFYGFYMSFLLMTGKIRSSKYVEYYRAKQYELKGNNEWLIHIDGESVDLKNEKLYISTIPKCLKIIVP
jgi:YegS/Rv2252/BmrU family lipid kinase